MEVILLQMRVGWGGLLLKVVDKTLFLFSKNNKVDIFLHGELKR